LINFQDVSLFSQQAAQIGIVKMKPFSDQLEENKEETLEEIIEGPDTAVSERRFSPETCIPSDWHIIGTEDGIEATNRLTGEAFVGKMSDFNIALRG